MYKQQKSLCFICLTMGYIWIAFLDCKNQHFSWQYHVFLLYTSLSLFLGFVPPQINMLVLCSPLRTEMAWWLASMSWWGINWQSLSWIWGHLNYAGRCSHLGRQKPGVWLSCLKGPESTLWGRSSLGRKRVINDFKWLSPAMQGDLHSAQISLHYEEHGFPRCIGGGLLCAEQRGCVFQNLYLDFGMKTK